MIKNIVFVESPLQCINAINYVKEVNKGESLFIIRLNGIDENDLKIKNIVKREQTRYIKFIFFTVKPRGFLLIFWAIIFKLVGGLLFSRKKMIFGDFRSKWMKIIFASKKPELVVFVDDGLATIAYIDNLLEFKKKFTLFTVFNIENNNLNIIKNKSKKREIIGKDVIFIGMPLSEKDIVDKEAYVKYLCYILDEYKGRKVIYCPHRSEVNLSNDLLIKLGFSDVFKSLNNIEDAIEVDELQPDTVISFYSTALCNLDLKFNIREIRSYKLCENDINPEYVKSIKQVYSYFDLYTKIKISEINDRINY